jgi:hypothetical protein
MPETSKTQNQTTDWNEVALLRTWTQNGRTLPRVPRSPAAQHLLNGSSTDPADAIHRAAEAARYREIAPTLSSDDWAELARAAGHAAHLRGNQSRYLALWPERVLPGLHGEQRFANSAGSIAHLCEDADRDRLSVEERIWGPPIPSPTPDQIARLAAEVAELSTRIPAARAAARTAEGRS